jgi:hypothetical protein
VKTYFLIVITAFLLVASVYCQAQRKKNKFKSGGVIELNDSLTTYGQSDIFNFPNINKLPFYKEENILIRMERLEGSLALEELYNTLKLYVSIVQIGSETLPEKYRHPESTTGV